MEAWVAGPGQTKSGHGANLGDPAKDKVSGDKQREGLPCASGWHLEALVERAESQRCAAHEKGTQRHTGWP